MCGGVGLHIGGTAIQAIWTALHVNDESYYSLMTLCSPFNYFAGRKGQLLFQVNDSFNRISCTPSPNNLMLAAAAALSTQPGICRCIQKCCWVQRCSVPALSEAQQGWSAV